MGEGDRLAIREVEIVWGGKESICVRSGLADGERIVTSDIGTPVQGMPLRLAGSPKAGGKSSPPGDGKAHGGRRD
jgi:hypothetical protein